MKVLATYSIKGGVGKTAGAVNLAHEAALHGARVLLWDLDPQAAATFLARVKPGLKGGADRMIGPKGELDGHIRATNNPGVHLLPSDFSIRHLDLHLDAVKRPLQRLAELLAPAADHYDVVLLDCAPSISLTSESVFGAADALLVPTIPTPLSARTLEQLNGFLAGWPAPPTVLPYFSIVDRRKKLQRDSLDALAARWPFLPTAIPNSSTIEQMGTYREPVAEYAPRSKAAAAFRSLWEDIASRLWP